MGEFVADPGDAIADAVVAFLNSPSRDFHMSFNAEHTTDPRAALNREGQKLLVLVYPVEAAEEKTGRGGQVVAEERVHVVVRGTLDEELTRRTLLGLAYEIKRSLRGEWMAGWAWSANETVTKYDPEQIQDSDLFWNAVRVTYRNMK